MRPRHSAPTHTHCTPTTQLLRIMGYKTDAVEFTSAEHTPRNLLLRAVRADSTESGGTVGGVRSGQRGGHQRSSREVALAGQLLGEYDELCAFWGGVTPRLEELLVEELGELREAVAAAAEERGRHE
jgi:hypothetical protein